MIDLLERFHGVRGRGDGKWIAKCPGPLHKHGDRKPSLSVGRAADRWLIHCYTGCLPIDIVRAVGLELADLFDDCIYRPRGDQVRPRLSGRERLELLETEISAAFWIITDFMKTNAISDEDYKRLALALGRIGVARHG
jgi:hypothetical protein